ncbi:hypothetical protein, partial [Kitasatospora indigofera]|uniref:hypothetical protein n=1 Tax=Kitasatospora indigofera TaxID=67307 RepID=UPI001E2CB908
DDPIEAAMLRQTGVSASAGGTDGLGSVIRRTVLDHMIHAAEQADGGLVTVMDLLARLSDIDPDRYARTERESANAWQSRASKALKSELASLGAEVEQIRITQADGSRPMGYALADLRTAATGVDNAA